MGKLRETADTHTKFQIRSEMTDDAQSDDDERGKIPVKKLRKANGNDKTEQIRDALDELEGDEMTEFNGPDDDQSEASTNDETEVNWETRWEDDEEETATCQDFAVELQQMTSSQPRSTAAELASMTSQVATAATAKQDEGETKDDQEALENSDEA